MITMPEVRIILQGYIEQRFMLMVNIALPLEKRMPRDCDSILLMIPLIGT